MLQPAENYRDVRRARLPAMPKNHAGGMEEDGLEEGAWSPS